MVNCSVTGCTSRSEKTRCSFFTFPKNKLLRRKWIKATGRPNWTPSLNSRICSGHFDKTAMVKMSTRVKLKCDSVPTKYLPVKGKKREENVEKTELVENNTTNGDIVPAPVPRSCRICLRKLERQFAVSLFGPWSPPWEGMEGTVAEDLMKVTQIYIHNNDTFSKIICRRCATKLRDACSFVKLILKNDEILKCIMPGESEKEDLSLSWPKPIKVEDEFAESLLGMQIKEEIVSDEEDQINGQYQYSYNDDMEIKIEPEELIDGNVEEPINGLLPAFVVNGVHSLSEDLLAVVKEEPPDDITFSDLPKDCLLCSKLFKSISGLKAHVIVEHSYKSVKRKRSASPTKRPVAAEYTCETCEKSFVTSTDLMVHSPCHKMATCYRCHKQFRTMPALNKHAIRCRVKRDNNRKLLTLDDVRRIPPADLFPSTQNKPVEETPELVLENQEIIVFNCEFCDEIFTAEFYLKVHMEAQHYEETLEVLENDSSDSDLDTTDNIDNSDCS